MSPSILVLVQGYPSEADRYNLAYVHTRLLLYRQAGLELRVLNFGTDAAYEYEGIEVLSEKDWLAARRREDLLISHAPNLRNHLRFMLRYGRRFRRWLCFFHGHEVLLKARYYPAPYDFSPRSGKMWHLADQGYDLLKLRLWRQLFRRWLAQDKLALVFVSRWMREAFEACVGLGAELIDPHAEIIPNSVHPAFLQSQWQAPADPVADFVTIRPLDNPKYAVDQVSTLARQHPQLRFHVYGRGQYFVHHPPPANLQWFDKFLKPEEMITLLPRYRAALMPTRLDAQGVMMCELASFDMPLLTSDLPICREMLDAFPRVGFLPEDLQNADLSAVLTQVSAQHSAPDRQIFAPERTVGRELELIRRLRKR